MQRVVEELGASVTMDIRYFIADVSKGDHEWKRLLEPFGELHITVVVHNVGGEPLVDTRYVSITASYSAFRRLTSMGLDQNQHAQGNIPVGRRARDGSIRPRTLPSHLRSAA